MRAFWWATLLLVGCGPVEAVLGDPSDPSVDDTDAPSPDDTSAPGDTEVPGDTADDTAPPPPPEPDFSVWEGVRVFDFPSLYGTPCEDEVEEAGVNVEGNEDFAEAFEVCADCDHIFRVEVDPTRICGDVVVGDGIPVSSPVIRGLKLNSSGEVEIYTITRGWSGWRSELLATGELDGVTLGYSYTGSAYGASFTATGTVDF